MSDPARQLNPQLPRPWSLLGTVLGAIAVFGLSAPAVGCAVLALLGVLGWPLGVSAGIAAAGCALVVLAGVPLLHLPTALREQQTWSARQAQAAARWDRLYYCARDDVAFAPSARHGVRLEELAAYLVAEARAPLDGPACAGRAEKHG